MTAHEPAGQDAAHAGAVPEITLNRVPEAEALRTLLAVCSAPAWARAVAAGRPYAGLPTLLAASDAAVAALTDEELAEALAGHPRIGARSVHSAASRREQAGMASASDELRAAIAAGNAEYERRFGHVYLVCAAGRTATELLGVLTERLANTPEQERARTRSELAAINRLRLHALAG